MNLTEILRLFDLNLNQLAIGSGINVSNLWRLERAERPLSKYMAGRIRVGLRNIFRERVTEIKRFASHLQAQNWPMSDRDQEMVDKLASIRS